MAKAKGAKSDRKLLNRGREDIEQRLGFMGWEVGGALRRSPEWRGTKAELGSQRYLRIHSDRESFGTLCALRDRLVTAGEKYNWHRTGENELVFSVGRDERVQ